MRGLNYYLRAPGRYEAPRLDAQIGAGFLFALGGILISGAAGLAVGLQDPAAAIAASAASGALGIGVIIGAGWIALDSARAVAQEGSTTHWVEPWPR